MSDSFPMPLNEKEEEYYLSLYQTGDEEAKKVLIERNLRLVAHIAEKIYCGNLQPRRPDINRYDRIDKSRKYIQQQAKHKARHICRQVHRKRNTYEHKVSQKNQRRSLIK